MTRHKCSESCTRAAQNGPKIKCCKCQTVCFLNCFGFEAGAKVDNLDTVKLSVNGFVFTTYMSTLGFSCCTDVLTPTDQKKALKIPAADRSSSRNRATSSKDDDKILVNELKSMKEMLSSIQHATDANTAAIAEIKSLSTQTDANLKKVTEQNAVNHLQTPNGPAMNYVQQYRTKSYAKAAAGTPLSAKRKRSDSPPRQKPNFPTPKVGTKSNVNGLSVVPKLNRNRDERPKYEKALYVSGLDPMTSSEQLAEFIIANTPVNDLNRFKVHKMVKKDADVSKLKFVSFKVELNVNDLEILENVELWPEGIQVREFQIIPKNELGRHFPPLPANGPTATPNSTEASVAMDT